MKTDGYFTPNRYSCRMTHTTTTYDRDGEFLSYEEHWEDSGKAHTDLMWEQSYFKKGNTRGRLIDKVERKQRANKEEETPSEV